MMPLADATAVLDRFVDKAGKLYTLPAVAVQVLQLTNHPKSRCPEAEGVHRKRSGADDQSSASRE